MSEDSQDDMAPPPTGRRSDTRRVLIAGAGIAGPALAWWLRRYGITPVVVERFPVLRPGGQKVDVRGAARDVTTRMGMAADLLAASSGEDGIAFVDDHGRRRAEMRAGAFGGEGFVSDVELLRGQLCEMLYARTRADVEYVFGDQIAAVADRDGGVHVELAGGATYDVDLVVAADGLRSRTRALVFGDQGEFRSLGLYMSYFTVPRAQSDGTWARWFNAPGGRVVALRPDSRGTTKAMLSILAPPQGWEDLGSDEQKKLIAARFGDLAWSEVPRVLQGLREADDFYLEAIGQIRMPRWSSGRTVLLGDAAYCASPVSGMGSALALVGAYVLAGELASHVDHRDAFAAYERVMRPYVDRAQDLPPGTPRTGSPRTAFGIACMHAVLRLGTAPGVRVLTRRLLTTEADAIDLPDYSHLETGPASP